jgi:hypothetical protein
MTHTNTSRLYKQRHGACHRCGWNGLVCKVKRSDSRRFGIVPAYGRLCAECSAELLYGHAAVAGTERPDASRLRLVTDDKVA